MAYALIGGVVLVSFIVPAIIGFDDGWFVPLVILPPAIVYLYYDQRLRRRGE